MSPTPQTPPTDRPLTAGDDKCVGRFADRPWMPGDDLPDVGTYALVSGANCDVDSDQHRGYMRRRVVGYGADDAFVCFQTDNCWPTVERTTNCWFARIESPRPATSAASEVTTQACVDWDEYADDIADVISDSLEMDWTSSDGARAVVRWLNENAPYYPAASPPSSATLVQEIVQALAPDQGERAHPAFCLAVRLQAALASPPVSERERELEGALRLAKERIQSWPIDDHETCMCGSLVEGHDIGSGHSPVSQADHAISTIVQEIDRALTAQPQEPV